MDTDRTATASAEAASHDRPWPSVCVGSSGLDGILFVMKTGVRWNHLPTRLGFGSGATCWRRLRDWQEAGVWDRLHELLLAKLREAGQLDFSRAAVDSSSV